MKEKIQEATITLNNNMVKYIRGFLFEIRRRENFTNEVLAVLLSKTPEEINEFMNEKWEGTLTTSTLSRLILLGLPYEEMLYHSLPEETKSEKWLKFVDEYINTFKNEKKHTDEEVPAEVNQMAEGIVRLLKLLGISTNEEINALCDIMEGLNKDGEK